MAKTIQELLDEGNASLLPIAVAQLRDDDGDGFGSIISGMVPGFVVRTGLVSQTTHIESNPGTVLGVLDEAGSNERAIVLVAAAGAGEVFVAYDAAGIPTLVFGDGATTGYQILQQVMPQDIRARLAAIGA